VKAIGGTVSLAAYIGTIYAANWAIVTYGIVPIGLGLAAPAGVLFAGFAFTARDAVHETLGARWSIVAIVAGAALSALLSPALAIASGGAFLVSELVDLGVYTPLRHRRHMLTALVLSNTVGAAIDSALFLSLAGLPLALVVGQIVGKSYTTAAAAIVRELAVRVCRPTVNEAVA
jgi:uncharacterized PurR-regulated membrane protein YhhQ (DUF165 family)